MKSYRQRFLGWKHKREMAGEKITLRQVADMSRVHHTVIQRLAAGTQKTFKAETLEKIGQGIGEGPDFFFREEATPSTGIREKREVYRTDDRLAMAMDVLEAVKSRAGCNTFTVLCVRSKSEIEVMACERGELVYHGPDRREHRKARQEERRES